MPEAEWRGFVFDMKCLGAVVQVRAGRIVDNRFSYSNSIAGLAVRLGVPEPVAEVRSSVGDIVKGCKVIRDFSSGVGQTLADSERRLTRLIMQIK
jgi:hypothetical protein